MPSELHPFEDLRNPGRREIMRTAGAITMASLTGSSFVMSSPAFGQEAPTANVATRAPERNSTPLGLRIQGVQHIGITVQNMDRAFEFYTEVLGGTEVLRGQDFAGDRMHNAVLLADELDGNQQWIDPRTIGVPDLRNGAQRLDIRLVQFDNMVVELLQYRNREQPPGRAGSFAPPSSQASPAYPRSMHICFHIRDDVDFNQFIHDLEAESARRGMTNVKANRVISVLTEQSRQQAPFDSSTNKITEGPLEGLAMIYAKGPEGEQLEFLQVRGHAKDVFDGAYEARRRMQ